mgnify:CR=1 FL=1
MSTSIPTQLRFPPFAGFTVRADFEGRALSSDFGPLLLRGDPYTDFLFGLTGNRRLKKRWGRPSHCLRFDCGIECLSGRLMKHSG